MIKRSLFSQIEFTSDAVKALQSEVNKERKSFIESLTSDQMANLFPPGSNLGTFSNNKPITQKDIASQDSATPVATAPDGSTVMIDPTTGKPIIVSDNPDEVNIKSPEDVQKLAQLALLARQAAQTANPNQTVDKQQQTNQQTQATQKSAQQQQANRISEEKVDDIHSFMSDLNQIFSSGPVKSETPYETPEVVSDLDEEEKKEVTDEVKDEVKVEPAVEVDHVADNFIDIADPLDTLFQLPTFWQPSTPDLMSTVTQTQQAMGMPTNPVIEKPIMAAKPNMRQYVKTTRSSSVPGVVDNFSVDDFSDVMGLDSPISIKLSLEVNK